MNTGSELGDTVEEYNRSLRDRTMDSLEEVRQTLNRGPTVSPNRRRQHKHEEYRERELFSESYIKTGRSTEHSDYSYGAAVNKLRHMLHKSETQQQHMMSGPKHVLFGDKTTIPSAYEPSAYMTQSLPPQTPVYPVVPGMRGDIPTPEEVVPLLQNQSSLLQQLELENKFLKDETHALKQKVRETTEENKVLHEELKTSIVQEILGEGIEVPGVPTSMLESHAMNAGVSISKTSLTKQEYSKWQVELEKVTTLHTARSSRLEAQLSYKKEELEKLEKENDALRTKLRMADSVSAVDRGLVGLTAGLCIRCGQNEAVLPANLTTQKQTLEKVTKERDELMDQLTGLRSKLELMKHREEDAYQQVKKSVELVETAQLEQTQALVQREQLKEELANMRKRMEEHVEEMSNKMQTERELVRKESKAERDELNEKIKEMTESLVNTQTQLERTTRDKVTLMSELEAYKGQISGYDLDYSRTTDNMKMSITQATLERNKAVQEMHKLRVETERELKEKGQEMDRLKMDHENLRKRLNLAEKELVDSKEECIRLHTTIQQVEREAHLNKLAKESIERNRSDDLKAVTKRAEQREEELNRLIDQVENRHGQTISELEEIMNSQTALVQKLREECRRTAGQLENVSNKYKGENKKLKSENSQLRYRLDKAHKRLSELEDQHVQQAALQDKMRERLKQMDSTAQHTSHQIMDMLNKESKLMRDRQLLAQEIEFLRRQLGPDTDNNPNRQYSSEKGIIDTILERVNNEEIITDA